MTDTFTAETLPPLESGKPLFFDLTQIVNSAEVADLSTHAADKALKAAMNVMQLSKDPLVGLASCLSIMVRFLDGAVYIGGMIDKRGDEDTHAQAVCNTVLEMWRVGTRIRKAGEEKDNVS